jgi:3-deoxy-manno-octulosonate cytidylyltransferase (CMP-KDO synthetase)
MKLVTEDRFTGIIPARYASTRFPGKALADIGGKSMIQRVYEQSCKALPVVFVATDDNRIINAVLSFGGKAIMTSPHHRSGTDRCSEAVDKIEAETGNQLDVVINIQGDEPFIKPDQIKLLMSCFSDESVEIATLIRKVEDGEDLFNPNEPKVVISSSGDALYFSRSTIPYFRDADRSEWAYKHTYYKHPGIYAYKKLTLKKITMLHRSPLEITESLEQNRWIENNYKIRTAITNWDSIGIDTPEDIEKAKEILKNFD